MRELSFCEHSLPEDSSEASHRAPRARPRAGAALWGVPGPRAYLTWAPGNGRSAVSAESRNHRPESGPGKHKVSPPVPPREESGASAVSKGLSGAGDTDPSPPGQQQCPPARLPHRVLRAAPLSCKHPPWAREVGARASDVGRGAWAAETQSVLSPQVRGAGAETSPLRLIRARLLPAPPRPSLAAGSCPRLSPHLGSSWTPCASESEQGPQTWVRASRGAWRPRGPRVRLQHLQ